MRQMEQQRPPSPGCFLHQSESCRFTLRHEEEEEEEEGSGSGQMPASLRHAYSPTHTHTHTPVPSLKGASPVWPMNQGGEGRPTIDPHKGRLGRAAAAWGTPGHRAPQSLFSLLFQDGGGAAAGGAERRAEPPGPVRPDL